MRPIVHGMPTRIESLKTKTQQRSIFASRPRILYAGHRFLAAIGLLILVNPPWVAGAPDSTDGSIRHLRSRHFLVSTDMPSWEARNYLNRMERVLKMAEQHWSRALPGTVECYLVRDLANWNDGHLPSDKARHVLRHVRGATDLQLNKRGAPSVVIYAMAEPGVAEHEVVHAYCFQTFGRGGPAWYREGMAELFSQEVTAEERWLCRPETIKMLDGIDPISMRDLTNAKHIGLSMTDVMSSMPRQATSPSCDDPSTVEKNQLAQARSAYAQSWALCYLLYHNRSYRDRFQAFGKHALSGSRVTLEQAFPGRLAEIDFELHQFVTNIVGGYQIEVCCWDWAHQSRNLIVGQSVTVRLKACGGFQPARIRLALDQRYTVRAQGAWHLEKGGLPIDADGNGQGHGCLEAAVLNEFNLSHPIQLGKDVVLSTDQAGDLYLRCRDHWDRIGDNRGRIAVRLTRVQ